MEERWVRISESKSRSRRRGKLKVTTASSPRQTTTSQISPPWANTRYVLLEPCLRLCRSCSLYNERGNRRLTQPAGRLVGRQVGWSLGKYIKRSSPPPSRLSLPSPPLYALSFSRSLHPPRSFSLVATRAAASRICGSAFHLIVGTICEDRATTVPIDFWR